MVFLDESSRAIGSHCRHRERSVAIQRPPHPCFATFGGGIHRLPGVSGSPRRFAPREDGAPTLGVTSGCHYGVVTPPSSFEEPAKQASRRTFQIAPRRPLERPSRRVACGAARGARGRRWGAWQLRRVAIGAVARWKASKPGCVWQAGRGSSNRQTQRVARPPSCPSPTRACARARASAARVEEGTLIPPLGASGFLARGCAHAATLT